MGNGGGGGKLERQRMDLEGRECKILQPRGTHGDVISTTEPETYYNPAVRQPRSHSVSMYEWPILLGLVSRKVYLFRLPPLLLRTPLAARLTRDEHRAACVFSHPFNLHGRVRGTKIPFFAGTRDQDDGTARRRNASCIADFFHYDS